MHILMNSGAFPNTQSAAYAESAFHNTKQGIMMFNPGSDTVISRRNFDVYLRGPCGVDERNINRAYKALRGAQKF